MISVTVVTFGVLHNLSQGRMRILVEEFWFYISNSSFLQVSKSKQFFTNCFLPELKKDRFSTLIITSSVDIGNALEG